MRMTAMLKAWLIEKYGIEKDATDDVFKAKAAEALTNGDLTAEKLVELTTEPEEKEADEFMKKFEALTKQVGGLVDALSAQKETPKEEEKEVKKVEEKKIDPNLRPASPMEKAIAAIGGYPQNEEKSVEIRVKEAVECYDSTRTKMTYPEKTRKGGRHNLAGEPVYYNGEQYQSVSEQDKALAGTWLKFYLGSSAVRGALGPHRTWEGFSEHEKSLLAHLAEKGDWYQYQGDMEVKNKGYRGNTGTGIKALIDDTTSGGLEAAPIVFDDMVIEAPLLYGELYPLVNTVPLNRGRRVEGVAVGKVTGSWGGVDDTAITLFTTTSYVTAFDTTIYRWQGAVRIGLDFLSDSPIGFAEVFTRQYGERLLEDLDDVIATGNGTTQPEGVMNKTGVTAVAFGATQTVTLYETLRFTVPKNEHTGPIGKTAVFCGTETSYSRAVGMPVGASDQRRVFGTESGPNWDGYSILQRPFKINESLTNAQIFYAIMGRYRMYRRKDMTVRTSTEGDTLIRNNEMLIAVMARFGGQMERAACAALTTTAAV